VGDVRPRLGLNGEGPVKTSLRVARRVIRSVIEQDLPPGTKLPGESALMEDFGVSRSSMREALRILETNGFISVRPGPGGGPVLNPVSPVHFGKTTAMFLQMSRTTLAEVLDARKGIESLAARQAALHPASERLEPLRASVRMHEEYAQRDEYEHAWYVPLVHEFHEVLVASTDNGVLELFSLALQSIVSDRVSPVFVKSDRWLDVLREHIEIGEAILSGQPDRAQELMEAHMSGFCETYRNRYPLLIDEVIDGD
jgi:DNA-binding FadR family transcriptional regulator